MAVTLEDMEVQTISENVSIGVRTELVLADMANVAYPLDGLSGLAGTSCCWSAVKTCAPKYRLFPKGTNALWLIIREVGPC